MKSTYVLIGFDPFFWYSCNKKKKELDNWYSRKQAGKDKKDPRSKAFGVMIGAPFDWRYDLRDF